ncbi:large conductance mechanosensitive channel protein [Polychytrium aggregatum]|uniref:large conductance mechanosensitive channel protein n=1 Tax=Polychytrium aggregatum TaxID=110093 RepID=UPI0022FE80D9|nr:large conductance mechanosensitive channel protein [Polychytrium aggregatum]KAI9201890.1 large conductance mechanosensitive channel protein [Polychytrium aggregatum]
MSSQQDDSLRQRNRHLLNLARRARFSSAAQPAVRATKSFFEDFKKFISRGNVVDLAVGVVVGGAFSAIVTSFVNDLISPILSLIVGVQLKNYFLYLREPNEKICPADNWHSIQTPQQAQACGAVTLDVGAFIQTVINFILISLVLFVIIRTFTRIIESQKKKVDEHGVPTERECPYCLKEVPIFATKCFLCCSELPPIEESTNLDTLVNVQQ